LKGGKNQAGAKNNDPYAYDLNSTKGNKKAGK
jgi:hypothetical protein